MKKSLFSLAALVFSIQLDAMFLARKAQATARRPVSKQSARQTVKRTHHSVYTESKKCISDKSCPGLSELRTCIANPGFEATDALKIVTKIPHIEPEDILSANHCIQNSIIQDIVHKASLNRNHAYKYAQLISALGERGWYVHYDCCEATSLHTAVKLDMVSVAKALIQSSGDNLLKDDKLGRVPHHYIQSLDMADLILSNYGVGGLINAQDHEGNTPLHFATGETVECMVSCGADTRIENKVPFFKHTYQTPLRKAVSDADIAKCRGFFHTQSPVSFVSDFEYALLKRYIAMRLYETSGELHRFDNKLYREIACILEESHKG